MATTGNVPVTPGSGANVAVFTVSRDSVTEDIQAIALVDATSATPALIDSNGNLHVATAPGTTSVLYAAGTLAAATNSPSANMSYCNAVTVLMTATGASAGQISIWGSADNVTFFLLPSPYFLNVSAIAATTVMALPPCPYYQIRSTVALSALSVQFAGSW